MGDNIAETFVQSSRKNPERMAVKEARTGKSITFKELNARANAYSYFFQEQNIRAGETVILMVSPSVEFICITLALFKLGTPIILIDPGMGYKNLLRSIARVKPQILIGIPKALVFAKLFRTAFKTVKKMYCCGASYGLLGANITTQLKNVNKDFPVYQPHNDDLAAIIFTTGSTGPPKGVRYEHTIFAAQLRLIKEYYRIGDTDVDQPAFPLFALFAAALGASSVIPDMDPTQPAKVDPGKFVSSILSNNVSYSFGSPAIWNVVSNYCIENQVILSSVQKVLMAGAPVPYDLLQRVKSILPEHAEVFTPYGATESLPVVSIESQEVVEETWQKTSIGRGTCVGRALPGIDLRVITISDGVIDVYSDELLVPDGQIGEIIVKGDVVTKGYHHNIEETALAKIADGESFWHRMGDLGYLDGQKRLWFCGRRAHRVESAFGPLYTIPCEAIINEHPQVYRSALVGITDPKNDQKKIPVLIVEPYQGVEIDKSLLVSEVENLGAQNILTEGITNYLIHKSFPVDIRHNAKIFREKLAVWAEKKLSP